MRIQIINLLCIILLSFVTHRKLILKQNNIGTTIRNHGDRYSVHKYILDGVAWNIFLMKLGRPTKL